jgi:hypothetical protein
VLKRAAHLVAISPISLAGVACNQWFARFVIEEPSKRAGGLSNAVGSPTTDERTSRILLQMAEEDEADIATILTRGQAPSSASTVREAK